jgi:hypothetical protein
MLKEPYNILRIFYCAKEYCLTFIPVKDSLSGLDILAFKDSVKAYERTPEIRGKIREYAYSR